MDKRDFKKQQTKEAFGKKLTDCMNQRGISQTILAEILNTSQQTVSRWCKGTCEPDYDTLKLLSIILDEPLDDLLCYDSKELKNYYMALIEDAVANSKKFRSGQQTLSNKLLRKEITEKACNEKQKQLFCELVNEYCEKNKLFF